MAMVEDVVLVVAQEVALATVEDVAEAATMVSTGAGAFVVCCCCCCPQDKAVAVAELAMAELAMAMVEDTADAMIPWMRPLSSSWPSVGHGRGRGRCSTKVYCVDGSWGFCCLLLLLLSSLDKAVAVAELAMAMVEDTADAVILWTRPWSSSWPRKWLLPRSRPTPRPWSWPRVWPMMPQ